MRAFRCDRCDAALYFENSVCLSCGSAVGYARGERRMVLVGDRPRCANADLAACNWLAEPGESLCLNCRLTRTRPGDGDLEGLRQSARAEAAKRRLVAQLDDLELPVRVSDGYVGLAFDLLSSRAGPIVTGYHNGVITLDLAETDDAHREAVRAGMAEPYRTVLGHFRHELGHYYAELLALTTDRRPDFRRVFGDETASYVGARARHYEAGADRDWTSRFVSAYASMHPLEDFAETFAHYLHITDALQTARAYGLLAVGEARRSFTEVVADTWLPLAVGLNQISRSMGRDDLYPFVLSDQVVAKLAFVDELVRLNRAAR